MKTDVEALEQIKMAEEESSKKLEEAQAAAKRIVEDAESEARMILERADKEAQDEHDRVMKSAEDKAGSAGERIIGESKGKISSIRKISADRAFELFRSVVRKSVVRK